MVNGRETRNIPVSQQHNGIIEHSGQQESLAHTTNGGYSYHQNCVLGRNTDLSCTGSSWKVKLHW